MSFSAFDLYRTGEFQRNGRRRPTEHEMLAKGIVQNEQGWWIRTCFEGVLSWPASRNEEESV